MLVFAGAGGARAAGFDAFGGTRSGAMLIAQGTVTKGARLLGTALIKATSSNANSVKFVVTGTLGETKFSQVITLTGGKIDYSSTLPGLKGFEARLKGTYAGRGTRLTTKAASATGSFQSVGSIQLTNFGSTLVISSRITPLGGEPIYLTIIGH